jgi:hypothetical protein
MSRYLEGFSMSEEISTPVLASMSWDWRFLEDGKHSTILFLPIEYHAFIGLIVAHWGRFELSFDRCLESLVKSEALAGKKRDTLGWRTRNFKKLRKLFKTICKEWLGTKLPQDANTLCDIADDAAELARKRNMIAHGTYTYTMPPHSGLATNCRAIDTRTGEEMPFDADFLIKLRHDISHLNADLVMTFMKFAKVDGFHSLPDTLLLQAVGRSIHPTPPTERTPLRRNLIFVAHDGLSIGTVPIVL